MEKFDGYREPGGPASEYLQKLDDMFAWARSTGDLDEFEHWLGGHVHHLSSTLEKMPECERADFVLAVASKLSDLGYVNKAEAVLLSLEQSGSDSERLEAQNYRAFCLRLEGDFDRALALFDATIEELRRSGADREALSVERNRARCIYDSGDPACVVPGLRKLIKSFLDSHLDSEAAQTYLDLLSCLGALGWDAEVRKAQREAMILAGACDADSWILIHLLRGDVELLMRDDPLRNAPLIGMAVERFVFHSTYDGVIDADDWDVAQDILQMAYNLLEVGYECPVGYHGYLEKSIDLAEKVKAWCSLYPTVGQASEMRRASIDVIHTAEAGLAA